MEKNPKQHIFRARSDEVREILSRPPAWIIRWGTAIFFLFLVVLLGIAWLIPSPTVVPVKFRLVKADTNFMAIAQVSQDNYGRIKAGQKVTLRLNAYDYRQFGLLQGNVIAVSDQFDNNGMVTVHISLPADGNTSMRQKLQYKNAMMGTGEVIINEKKLIQQFAPF